MIKIIKDDENVKEPRRATLYSAGYDVFANETFIVPKNGKTSITIPVSLQFDEDKFKAQLFLRSSMGIKKHMRFLKNEELIPCVEIDSEKDIQVTLWNRGKEDLKIEKDSHFCQFVIMDKIEKTINFELEKVNDLQGAKPVKLAVEVRGRTMVLMLAEEVVIEKDASFKMASGLKAKIMDNTFLGGYIPKGEERFSLSNGVVVGDSDYYYAKNEGHYFFQFDNLTDDVLKLEKGTRLIELKSIPFYKVMDEIEPQQKRIGGQGSTSKKN